MEPKWRFAAAALLACTGLMMVVLCAPTFLVPRCVPIHPALNGIAASSKTLHACLESHPGEFSGTSEAHYILANLQDEQAKPKDTTICGSVYYGKLLGQPVVLATTGEKTKEFPSSCTGHIAAVSGFL
eukprot:scaffold185354_cov20-Tisochrysis_lutea.AAC.1